MESCSSITRRRTNSRRDRPELELVTRVNRRQSQLARTISFDDLRNQIEKDLFLDVFCFFDGKSRAYVTKILNGCGVDPDS